MPAGRDDNSNAPLKAWVRALEKTASVSSNSSVILPALIDDLADEFGTTYALLGDRGCLSYRALAERCNRYARWALEQGLAPGDVVCVIMPNCPDYMAIWLGVTRVGGIVSLVNTHLMVNQLAHAINIVAPKDVIAAGAFVDAPAPARLRLST